MRMRELYSAEGREGCSARSYLTTDRTYARAGSIVLPSWMDKIE